MILKLKPDIKCPWAGAVLQAEAVLQTFQQNVDKPPSLATLHSKCYPINAC